MAEITVDLPIGRRCKSVLCNQVFFHTIFSFSAGRSNRGGFVVPGKANATRGVINTTNPRYANGSLRRKNRARIRAMGCECGICRGRLGPIHYEEPSDAAHPLSFVVDEIKPVSRWMEFGYNSAREAAEDWNNLQAAHYFCNAQKSNKIEYDQARRTKVPRIMDGDW